MKSILKELYNGNIFPAQNSVRNSQEYDKAMKSLTEIEDELMKSLSDDEKFFLEKFAHAQERVSSVAVMDGFIDGFSLRMRIAIEGFEHSKSPLKYPYRYTLENRTSVFVISNSRFFIQIPSIIPMD